MTSHILAYGLCMEHLKLTENTNIVAQIRSYVGKMNERPNQHLALCTILKMEEYFS